MCARCCVFCYIFLHASSVVKGIICYRALSSLSDSYKSSVLISLLRLYLHKNFGLHLIIMLFKLVVLPHFLL